MRCAPAVSGGAFWSCAASPGVKRNLAVAALLAVLGAIHVSGWLDADLLPPYDFPGYASVAEDMRNPLLRHGEISTWNPKRFAGTTQYTSSLKERLMLPWVLLFGRLRGTQLSIYTHSSWRRAWRCAPRIASAALGPGCPAAPAEAFDPYRRELVRIPIVLTIMDS